MLKELVPAGWNLKIPDELDKFVEEEYRTKIIYPARENIFNAIKGLDPKDVKVVILGQDPYHEPGQAHGLSFSVQSGAYPPSLCNIFKELKDDLGIEAKSGDLSAWKKQGVLLLNTVLTVREHEANSHKDKGWEEVTADILNTVMFSPKYKVCILWGAQAKHLFWVMHDMQQDVGYIASAHPSPLSAYRGFFGSKPFSRANEMLKRHGIEPIDWHI
jgi:uracil-DNA glycosylase